MKIKILLLISLLIAIPALADEPSLGDVLYWKYYKQGADIQTKQDEKTGEIFINFWKHPDGLPVPTSSEIELAREEYKAFKDQEKTNKKTKKDDLLKKLKISDEEFNLLKELLRERSST